MPAISICIPVFNGAAFIREAVGSALAQDHPQLEVVVCDNVSTDGTLAALDGLDDPRLRIRPQQEHLGMAANWNRAARLATGEYVLMLSADDKLLPGAVAAFAAALHEHPSADLFIGQARFLVEGGDRPLARSAFRLVPGPVDDFEAFIVGNSFPVNINGVLMRREIVGFREDLGLVGDLDLMIRLAQAKKSAVLLEREVVEYREHAAAASTHRGRMWRESLDVYATHLPASSRPALYRRRMARILFWCGHYLAGAGAKDEARELLRRHSAQLGRRRTGLLRLTLAVPLDLNALERLRAWRKRLLGLK